MTDLHVRPPGRLAYGRVDSNANAKRACAAAAACGADAVIVTGDLTDCGLADEYAELARCLESLANTPVFLIPGNHDRRETLRRQFPSLPETDGFIHYTVEEFPLRLILLDSVVAGATHGHFCEKRLGWLHATLAAQPARETMLALHHPPLLTGVAPYDDISLRNHESFRAVVAAHPQVTRIISGHHHRMIVGQVAQAICVIAPAIAYQFEWPRDAAAEPGFVLEPSMFLLHDWAPGRGFVTHSLYVDPFPGPFPVRLEPEYPG